MEIKKVFKEIVPSSRFIGKKNSEWGLFWKNGWFDILEKAGGKSEFDYIAMKRVVNGDVEYWIGMLFDPNAPVPEGFDFVDFESFKAAVFWLYGNPDNGELYGLETHNHCLEKFPVHGFIRREDYWCIERCNCPRYTTPDEKGNVILDYYISIE
jgi:hypothetical protein